MSKRTKILLWVAFAVADLGIVLFVWSRSDSWPWREPKPWVTDDGPVFPSIPR
jgi:hypothetical protein